MTLGFDDLEVEMDAMLPAEEEEVFDRGLVFGDVYEKAEFEPPVHDDLLHIDDLDRVGRKDIHDAGGDPWTVGTAHPNENRRSHRREPTGTMVVPLRTTEV